MAGTTRQESSMERDASEAEGEEDMTYKLQSSNDRDETFPVSLC